MINIMFAGNYKVFDGMLIASLSILKHTKDPITAYILTMDLTEKNEVFKPINKKHIKYLNKIYKNVNPESEVKLLDITDLYKKEFENAVSDGGQYTPYTYLRLFADQIDELPNKILYLDTDVVANNDIKELYDIDITGYEVAGAQDYYGRWFFCSPKYMNAGVLLFNMEELRKTKMLNKAMKLCVTKKIFLNDQTAINRLAKKKLIVNRKFNEQKKLTEKTVIRHFSMTIKFFPWFRTQNIKPWHIENVHNILKYHQFDDILDDYQQRMKGFDENKEPIKVKEEKSNK